MTNSIQRTYNSKDEEIPVIGKFVQYSFKRDQPDFMSFSPRFSAAYGTELETKIASVSEVVMPKSETLDLKNITTHLYDTMDGLFDPINRVSGYLNMAHEKLTVSPADFGLTLLRKNMYARNAEGVITSLRTVKNNLTKHAAVLGEQGLTPELAGKFKDAATSIEADNQKQYEISSNRANIVQKNLGLLNSLYEQLMEILKIGKILYKNSDSVKTQEYTFSSLLKQVRIVSKQATAAKPVTTV